MSGGNRALLFAPHFSEYTTHLAEALSRHGQVLLVVNAGDRRRQCEPTWFNAATANVRVIEFSVSNRIWRAISPSLLIAAAYIFRPLVVHVQEHPDKTSTRVTDILSRRFPTVVTVHDPKPHSGADSDYLHRGALSLRDKIRESADMFHVHGAYCEKELRSVDTSRPVVQTLHGVIHVPRDDQRRDPDPKRILFFGRMEAYKGLGVLLDAMDILNGDGCGYTLVIAGRGTDLNALRDRAHRTPGVVLLDRFLSPDEVVDEYQKAAVVVLPYLDATQSGVAAGGVANGRPIVSTNVGGLTDVVVDEKNGLVIEPGDSVALAQALRRVLGDDALRAKLTAGSEATQLLLDWGAIAKTISAAYADLESSGWVDESVE
ncbi:MAG TPA: glycosyltransferase family 4 protein [Caulobacteraceae bacterium]|jgi:glycosyltransferase involved in cell wall biosynthesis